MSAIPAALLRHNFIPTTLAVLGPAAVARKARFDTALAVGEDLDLWLRLLQDGLKPVLSEKVTVHYRHHETNTTRDPICFAEEFTKVFEKHLLNPSLPPGACLRGVEYMLRPAIRMTRFRQPHRALHSLFRIWRARQRFTGAPKSAID